MTPKLIMGKLCVYVLLWDICYSSIFVSVKLSQIIIRCFYPSMSSDIDQTMSFEEALKECLIGSIEAPNASLLHRVTAALRGELPYVKSQIAFAHFAKQLTANSTFQQHWLNVLRKLIILDKLVEDMIFLEEIAKLDILPLHSSQSSKSTREMMNTHKFITAFWRLLKSRSTLQSSQDHIFNYRRSQRSGYLKGLTGVKILSQIHSIEVHWSNIRQFAQSMQSISEEQVAEWKKSGCYEYLCLQLLYKWICAFSCQLQCEQSLLSKLEQSSLEKIVQFRTVAIKFRQNCQAFINYINSHSHIVGFQEMDSQQIRNIIDCPIGLILDEYSSYRQSQTNIIPMSLLPTTGHILDVEQKPMSNLSVHIAPRLMIKTKVLGHVSQQNAFLDWQNSFSAQFPQREIMTIDLIFQFKLEESQQKSNKHNTKEEESYCMREDASCCSYDNRSTNVTSTYEINLKNYKLRRFDALPKDKLNFINIYSRVQPRWHGCK